MTEQTEISRETSSKWIAETAFEESIENGEFVYEHVTSESALRPRALKAPEGSTAAERALHDMTHLPFRSRCLVCIKPKSKSDQHRRLKLEQPLIPMDFAFWTDSGGFSLPILAAIHVISTKASALALPSKEFSSCAATELKRFTHEV